MKVPDIFDKNLDVTLAHLLLLIGFRHRYSRIMCFDLQWLNVQSGLDAYVGEWGSVVPFCRPGGGGEVEGVYSFTRCYTVIITLGYLVL